MKINLIHYYSKRSTITNGSMISRLFKLLLNLNSRLDISKKKIHFAAVNQLTIVIYT